MRQNCYNNDNKKQKKPKLNLMTDVLPTEILIDIFSRLLVNSICCIKCVSKALLKTVDDPFFAIQHMRRRFLTSCTTVEVPRLVLRTDSPHCRKHPIKYDGNELLTKSKHAIISEFWTRQCLYVHNFIFCNLLGFTRHGVDYKNGNTCLLLDPFKGEILMLPTTSDVLQVSTNTICRQDSYGMGFDNKTNTYKIVRISYHHKYKKGQLSQLTTEVLVLGTSSWRELPVVPPCYVTGKSASAHGDMHWLVHGDTKDLSSSFIRILSFDFKKEKFYWTPHPAALEKKPSLWNFLHVLNFKGSLALVEFSSSEDKYMKIWALKNNYGNKEWVLNYKIDVGQYLLSLPLRNLCLSECGEWEHGIFFNQQNKDSNSILFVDLTRIFMKNVLLKGPMYSMEVFSCTDSMISLKNYGDLVEPQEEQEGITECLMSQETNENLTKAKETNGRDFVYLRTQTEPACVSGSETKLTTWEGYTDFLSEEKSE